MQDFLDRLDLELATIASTAGSERPASSPAPRHRLRSRLAATLAALLGTAGVFALTGTSTAELPILDTPTTDASALREHLPKGARLGVDFSAAHQFSTPGGPGYVLVGLKSNSVCIVIPDPAVPGDFGTSCAPTLQQVERRGLQAQFPGELAKDPKATALSTFLLPDGARDVQLTANGATTSPRVQSGVVVTDLPTEAVLQWTVDGHPQRKRLEGPFPAVTYVDTRCPDGRTASYLPPASSVDPRDLADAVRRARTKACAR